MEAPGGARVGWTEGSTPPTWLAPTLPAEVKVASPSGQFVLGFDVAVVTSSRGHQVLSDLVWD